MELEKEHENLVDPPVKMKEEKTKQTRNRGITLDKAKKLIAEHHAKGEPVNGWPHQTWVDLKIK